jgi:hypothetical protein
MPGMTHISNNTLQGLLTYSMEQSPSWEATVNCAASQEIPRIYGTRKFLTVPTSVRQPSLSWANSIQSPRTPSTSWRSILILSSHLRTGFRKQRLFSVAYCATSIAICDTCLLAVDDPGEVSWRTWGGWRAVSTQGVTYSVAGLF